MDSISVLRASSLDFFVGLWQQLLCVMKALPLVWRMVMMITNCFVCWFFLWWSQPNGDFCQFDALVAGLTSQHMWSLLHLLLVWPLLVMETSLHLLLMLCSNLWLKMYGLLSTVSCVDNLIMRASPLATPFGKDPSDSIAWMVVCQLRKKCFSNFSLSPLCCVTIHQLLMWVYQLFHECYINDLSLNVF